MIVIFFSEKSGERKVEYIINNKKIYLKIYSSIFFLFLVDVFVFYYVIKRWSAGRCGEVPNGGKGLVAFRD